MKNDPNKNGMTYASHTLPSLHLFTPHQLTAPPNTHCMPITYPFIIPRNPQNSISITQQLHHMHKYNNSKSLFSHNCNGSIITKQQSKITKTPKQCFSQTSNCNIRAGLVITPHIQTTTCNRLLLSHLFPHNYNVSNMLHDALNRQKHLPLSTSFPASIMQHVHLQLHYRHHPTQAFTGLPPRGSLLPTPISSTHHLCMKLYNTCSNRTHTSILQKNVKRCRDGNVCEAYVIPFLFGSFFTVCHPYIDVHFLKCFFLLLLT